MSKHTQGPWKLIDVVGRATVYAGQTEIVAYASPTEESRANARLIAAAPELLHELQRVYDSFSGETFDWEPVRAAIAKATGEQQ